MALIYRSEARQMSGRKYEYKGRVLFVREYPAVNGPRWATFFEDLRGIERAYVTDGLSLGHTTEAQAQNELDIYAAAKGLKPAKERGKKTR